MIKVLLLADLHGQYGKMNAFLELDPDMVIIAGDLTEFGPVEQVRDLMAQIETPCFAVPGNCDPREIVQTIEDSSAVNLHGTSLKLGKITLTGLGGSNPTPFGTPFELSEEEIDQILTRAKPDRNIHNVLVSHAPPEGTLDQVGESNVGSTSVRKHMKEYDLVCCAHIHEEKGIKEVDGVTIVNPGPASDGNCAIIEFGDEAKDISVELITV